MKERPILFSAPMVRAILAGEKTQTRRVVKPGEGWSMDERADGTRWPFFDPYVHAVPEPVEVPCPFGKPGDRLWVRETWQHADWSEDGMPWIRYQADGAVRFVEGSRIPEAECEKLTDRWAELSDPTNCAIDGKAADRKWRPSIFMPRWASRITLEITDVRVQRLQEITAVDAVAEGVKRDLGQKPQDAFAELWESINGAGSWNVNPWVWAMTFTRVEVPAP